MLKNFFTFGHSSYRCMKTLLLQFNIRLAYISFCFYGLFLTPHLRAQSVEYSTVYGEIAGNQPATTSTYLSGDEIITLQRAAVLNSAIYTNEYDRASDNPNVIVNRFNDDGSLKYSTLLGPNLTVTDVEVSADAIFLAGYGTPNYLIGGASQTDEDIFVLKLDASGEIDFIYSHISPGYDVVNDMLIDNSGNIYLTGYLFNGGSTGIQALLCKISSLGSLVYQSPFGGNGMDEGVKLAKSGSTIFIAGYTYSTDYFGSYSGSSYGNGDLFIASVSDYTGMVHNNMTRRFGGDAVDYLTNLHVISGDPVLTGHSQSGNFPKTDGSTFIGDQCSFVTRFNSSSLNYSYSSIFGQSSASLNTVNSAVDGDNVYVLSQINSNGDILLAKLNSVSTNTSGNFYSTLGGSGTDETLSEFIVTNDAIYIGGKTDSPDFPNTKGNSFRGLSDIFVTRFDKSTGDLEESHVIGGTQYDYPAGIVYDDCRIHLFGLGSTDFPSTYPAINTGVSSPLVYLILDYELILKHSQLINCGNSISPISILIGSDAVFLSSELVSVNSNYPQTLNQFFSTEAYRVALTKIDLCPTGFSTGTDLIPESQTICQDGTPGRIDGERIFIPSSSLPPIYLTTILVQQPLVEARYQWEYTAYPITGGSVWLEIPGAVLQHFTPGASNTSTYYRRKAYAPLCCPTNLLSTSEFSLVEVNANTAPTVNAGGPFLTCPGEEITIGGSPTITGGTSPYTITWTNTASTSQNPDDIDPISTTVYTITVVDSNGCEVIDQAIVKVPVLNAGEDQVMCGTDRTILHAAPISGISGVSYSWSPSTNLSSSTSLQPIVTATGTYTLTATLTNSDNNSCDVVDAVVVSSVDAPVTADFAGADVYDCLNGEIGIGTSAETGFSYSWYPDNYLNDASLSETDFNTSLVSIPFTPNPYTLVLQASKGGCIFTDEVILYLASAYAGEDGCGPRIIGSNASMNADLDLTFDWSVVSGTGHFIGRTDTPITEIDPSTETTVYRLTTTMETPGGPITCTDDVEVPFCECDVEISVVATHTCPNANWGAVTLQAAVSGVATGYTVVWSSSASGLTYTGSSISLTETNPSVFTAKVMLNGVELCSEYIPVNQSNMTLPVFDAPDTSACPNTDVDLGLSSVAGYTYLWSPEDGLSSSSISNPVANIPNSTPYDVLVTKTLGGCTITDPVHVEIQAVPVNAGNDMTICGTAIFDVGEPTQSGYQYVWTPTDADWQEAADPDEPTRSVQVAIPTTLTLTATDPGSGCSSSDEIYIDVISSISIGDISNFVICSGVDEKINNTELPGASYSWSPATNLSCSNCLEPYVLGTLSSTTTYTVTVSYLGSCTPASDDVEVTVSTPSPLTLPPLTACPYTSVMLGNDAPTGAAAYTWTPASGLSGYNIRTPNLTSLPEIPVTYTLEIKNAYDCITSATQTVSSNQDAPLAGSPQSMCINNTLTLGSVSNPWGFTYNWHFSSGPSGYLLSSSSGKTTDFTPSETGLFSFYLEKIDSITSCATYSYLDITVNGTIIDQMPVTSVCSGGSVMLGATSYKPGTVFSWDADQSPSGIADDDAAMTLVTPEETTTYTLTAIHNGCVNSASTVISMSDSLQPEITLDDIIACFSWDSVTVVPDITVNPSRTYLYTWSTDPYVNANPGNTIVYVNEAEPDISLSTIGSSTYYVTVTSQENGCVATENLGITINRCPPDCQVLVSGPDTVCSGNDFQLVGSATPAGGTFIWNSTSDTNSSIWAEPITANHTYELIYSYGEACADTAEITVIFDDDCCPDPILDCDTLVITSNYICDRPVSESIEPPTVTNASSLCSLTFENNLPDGLFPLGVTSVTWTATNAEGDEGTCTQNVIFQYGLTNGGN